MTGPIERNTSKGLHEMGKMLIEGVVSRGLARGRLDLDRGNNDRGYTKNVEVCMSSIIVIRTF